MNGNTPKARNGKPKRFFMTLSLLLGLVLIVLGSLLLQRGNTPGVALIVLGVAMLAVLFFMKTQKKRRE